jgi:membrane protease YdiL (CAAX protease family)
MDVRKLLLSAGKIVLFLLVWGGLDAVVIFSAQKLGGAGWITDPKLRIRLECALAAAALAALVFMAFLVDKRGWKTLGLNLRQAPSGLIVGTLIGGGILLVPIGILFVGGYAHVQPDLSHYSLLSILVPLGIVFFNVIQQELLVRSYMFQELWQKYSAAVATCVTSIIFVGLHAGALSHGVVGLIGASNLALASLLLSLAYLRTGALWLPIGIHSGWNGVLGPVLGLSVTGADLSGGQAHVLAISGPALWTGGELGVEGGLAGLVGPIVGILIVWALFRLRSPVPPDLAEASQTSERPPKST